MYSWRFGNRAQVLRHQFVTGTNPPLIGHVNRPFIRAIADLRAGNDFAFAGIDPHQGFILNPQFFGVRGVDLRIAWLIGQRCQRGTVTGSSSGRSSDPLRAR